MSCCPQKGICGKSRKDNCRESRRQRRSNRRPCSADQGCREHRSYVTTSDNVRLFTRVRRPSLKRSNGRSVLLIHGLPSSSKVWACIQLALCRAGFLAISYDARGQGRSDKATDLDYSPQRLVLDAVQVAAAFDAVQPIVVGVSFGGGVVIGWAGGLVPELPPISGIVLIDTSASPINLLLPNPVVPNIGLTPPALAAIQQTGQLPLALTLTDVCRKCPSYAALAAGLDAIGNQANPEAVAKIVAGAIGLVTLVPLLPNIRVPTLVLHGNLDAVFPFDSAIFLRNNIAGAQLAGIPNRGHDAFVTDCPGTIQMLLDFLGNECQVCERVAEP